MKTEQQASQKKRGGIRMKRRMVVLLLVTVIFTLFSMTMVAYGAPNNAFDELGKMYSSPESQAAQNSMMGFLKGPLTIFFRLLFLGGIAVSCLMAVWALKKTFYMFKGEMQKAWNAKEDWKAGLIGAVVISLLMGGGWIGVLKMTQNMGVDPLTKIITQPGNSQNNGTSNNGTQNNGTSKGKIQNNTQDEESEQ